MSAIIEDKSVVLFQGDSVTHASRGADWVPNIGLGYAMIASSMFSVKYPEKQVEFVNRGFPGREVKDLETVWQEDCLDLKPNLVSLMMGINDCWRRYDKGVVTSPEEFEEKYREILDLTINTLNPKIILMEPFLLPVTKEQLLWREDLDPKINIVRKLAIEYKTLFVPTDGLFAQACTKAPPAFWAEDGVHPTPAGHALIAKAWLDVVKA